MKGHWTTGLVIGLIIGTTISARAAEQNDQPERKAAPPASSTSNSAPTTATHAATPQVTPLMSVEGSLTTLNLNAQVPSVELTETNGKTQTFTVDPHRTTIWEKGAAGKLEALRVGQHVKVRYAPETGTLLARWIQVLPSVPSSSTAGASSSTNTK